MVIIHLASFPPGSAKECGKCFADLAPLPEYLTMIGPYVYSTEGGGIKGITIYETDQARMAEALTCIYDRAVPFFGVPGYTYDVRAVTEVGEALKMVGLE